MIFSKVKPSYKHVRTPEPLNMYRPPRGLGTRRTKKERNKAKTQPAFESYLLKVIHINVNLEKMFHNIYNA